jgi:hypothetical protein
VEIIVLEGGNRLRHVVTRGLHGDGIVVLKGDASLLLAKELLLQAKVTLRSGTTAAGSITTERRNKKCDTISDIDHNPQYQLSSSSFTYLVQRPLLGRGASRESRESRESRKSRESRASWESRWPLAGSAGSSDHLRSPKEKE